MLAIASTPLDARPAPTTVVIDVLRATSTITTALAAGYARVRCVSDLDAARALAGPGRVLAGERGCIRPPGFALGNSPSEMESPLGEELVLTTTNGVPALAVAARCSPVVLIGCLLNLAAIMAALDGGDAQLLCAGTDGAAGLDDLYVAERIAGLRSDDARPVLARSTGGRALIAVGMEADIDACARESIYDIVPRLIDTDLMVIEKL